MHGNDTVAVLAVDMGRKRGLNLGTSISNCSARLILCQIAEPQFSMLRSRHNKAIYCPWPARFFWRAAVVLSAWNRSTAPQPQPKVMTFKWARSNAVALWPGVISRCCRKWIVSLSKVTTTVRRGVSSFLWCHRALETEIWHRHDRTHSCSMCTCMCKLSVFADIWKALAGVNQHHLMLEMITMSWFWGREKLTTNWLRQRTSNLV